MTLYNSLRTTSTRLLSKYKTGAVEIGRPVTTPGAEPYDPPTTSITWTEIDAVVTGVPQQMVDDNNIITSDRMIITQTPDFDEEAGDKLRIDGQVVAIVQIMPKLAAGDPVITKMVVRG